MKHCDIASKNRRGTQLRDWELAKVINNSDYILAVRVDQCHASNDDFARKFPMFSGELDSWEDLKRLGKQSELKWVVRVGREC
jgi:hypothetical protein